MSESDGNIVSAVMIPFGPRTLSFISATLVKLIDVQNRQNDVALSQLSVASAATPQRGHLRNGGLLDLHFSTGNACGRTQYLPPLACDLPSKDRDRVLSVPAGSALGVMFACTTITGRAQRELVGANWQALTHEIGACDDPMMGQVKVANEGPEGPRKLSAGPADSSRPLAWLVLLGTLLFSLMVFAGMWLTVTAPTGLRLWQLVLGSVAVAGAAMSRWFPLVGVALSGIATVFGWGFGVTSDPFLLASVGVLALAERNGSRWFPWWLLVAWAGLATTALIVGSPPNVAEFEDQMRSALLSAIILVAAWVLGVRTRQARQEAAARARTDERLRLARDVHDELSHSLGAIGVQAGVAAHVTALSEAELRATLQKVESQARGSLLELKSLLHSERSANSETDATPFPLTDLLRETARTAERSGLDVELGVTKNVDKLPVAIRTTVHRIVQEATTNAIRHAAASALRISVAVRGAFVEVSVSDDGVGAPGGLREGHGLTGMRERVALSSGELSIEPTMAGVTLFVRLPLATNSEVKS